MTNGEKIKEIFPYLENDDTDLVKVLNIDNLKSWWNAEYKEPTTKNDLVSDCEKMSFDIDFFNKPLKVVALDAVKNIVNELPSVTPIRPKGHWIPVYQGDEIIDYRCSECEFGNTFGKGTIGMDFCPRCGSDNREVE